MKKQTSALDRFLDGIIEKYTATPRKEVQICDYTSRPTKKELEEELLKAENPVSETSICP